MREVKEVCQIYIPGGVKFWIGFGMGSYVSGVYSLQKASVKANSICDHTNLVEYNKYTETESYKKKNATYCYKTRIVQNARCAKCGYKK